MHKFKKGRQGIGTNDSMILKTHCKQSSYVSVLSNGNSFAN